MSFIEIIWVSISSGISITLFTVNNYDSIFRFTYQHILSHTDIPLHGYATFVSFKKVYARTVLDPPTRIQLQQ